LRARDVQDAREFTLVFVLHRDGSGYRRTHNRTTRTQIDDLYAVLMNGTQELFDLAEQLNWRSPAREFIASRLRAASVKLGTPQSHRRGGEARHRRAHT
jgi:hypothetical protein